MADRIPPNTPPEQLSWWNALKGEARRRGVLRFAHDGLLVLQLPGDTDPPADAPPAPGQSPDLPLTVEPH